MATETFNNNQVNQVESTEIQIEKPVEVENNNVQQIQIVDENKQFT